MSDHLFHSKNMKVINFFSLTDFILQERASMRLKITQVILAVTVATQIIKQRGFQLYKTDLQMTVWHGNLKINK